MPRHYFEINHDVNMHMDIAVVFIFLNFAKHVTLIDTKKWPQSHLAISEIQTVSNETRTINVN